MTVSKMEVDEEEEKASSSDSEQAYLISRARKAKTQREARAWMITAKLMFPNDLNIQLEAYLAEKRSEKVQESAKYLHSMFVNFPKDPRVWKELNAMVECLLATNNAESGATKGRFSPLSVFEALPSEVQEKIVVQASHQALQEKGGGLLEYVRLILISIQLFPCSLNTHAPKMLRHLVEGVEVSKGDKELLNIWIQEASLKVLTQSSLILDDAILKDLVHLTIHDYVFQNCILGSERPSWDLVFKILHELGNRLHWSLSSSLETEPLEVSLNKVLTFSQKKQMSTEAVFEMYSVCLVLFLKSFSDYLEEASSSSFETVHLESKQETDYVLVEAFVTHEVEEGSHGGRIKRRRTTDEERRTPLITMDEDPSEERSKRSMTDHFLYALHFYQLLHSEKQLEAMFSRLLEDKGASKALTSFSIDSLIYESKYREALQILRQLPTPVTQEEQGRFHLKMATVQYCLKDSNAAADQIIQALACLPPSPGSKALFSSSSSNKTKREEDVLQKPTVKIRHLHFLHYSRRSIISYVSRILINLLRNKGFQPSSPESDMALGHIIVLLQYTWPCETDLFYMILHRIRLKENFVYPLFCTYVVEIEFLEEFMWLASEQGGSVALDICPRSHPTPTSGRRVGTRGANRGEKEEFKTAIRKQVKRCHEDMDTIIIDFLNQNKDSVFQCLM